MSTRNRVDGYQNHEIQRTLFEVLHNTTNFLKCPLDDAEMLKTWHAEFPAEILAALSLLEQHRYYNTDAHSEPSVTFLIPDFQGPNGVPLAMRWQLLAYRETERRFIDVPTHGQHRIPMVKSGNRIFRPIRYETIRIQLGAERCDELFEWASAAAAASARHIEARATIISILGMITTSGQLRRMVPELVGYLPHHLQNGLTEQKRASPFPNEWAEYPKDRVERLTAALAEGHLLAGMRKQSAGGTEFSWAQFAPPGWEGVPYVS